MKKGTNQQDESFKQQQMKMQQQQLTENQSQIEIQFDTKKKLALEAMQEAVQTIQQIVGTADIQSLQQASQRLQQAIQQLNYMQGITITQSKGAEQQQLEQVQQQIEQAAQTLQLIQSLNEGNNSFKKG